MHDALFSALILDLGDFMVLHFCNLADFFSRSKQQSTLIDGLGDKRVDINNATHFSHQISVGLFVSSKKISPFASTVLFKVD